MERFGAATLVKAGGTYFLFDCGRGATQRLWQQNIGAGKVNRLFLTHLHSDHIVGIPDLWLLGLMPGAFGNRKELFEVWGPAGTREMMQGLKQAYQWDIKTRVAEYPSADSGTIVKAQNITEGIVYYLDDLFNGFTMTSENVLFCEDGHFYIRLYTRDLIIFSLWQH